MPAIPASAWLAIGLWPVSTPAGVPTGSVFTMATTTVPSGYLECDGSAVSRTTYADLFAAIGTTWGSGNGSSTFNVPDLRGEFVRGWDNGRGIDTGRTFASSQSHQLQLHSHTESYNVASSGQDQAGSGSGDNDNVGSKQTATSGTTGNFGSETSPRNIAMMYVIKA